MTSYIVYLLEITFPYKGLNCVGELGTKKGYTPIYDCYPQLQYRNQKRDYKWGNDAFIMKIVQTLSKDYHKRMSLSVKAFIKNFEYWFIQFPKFTYIRAKGFSRFLYCFPRYPSDRIILLELNRKLQTTHSLLQYKHCARVPYPIAFGQGVYLCLATPCAEYLEKELVEYKLELHIE